MIIDRSLVAPKKPLLPFYRRQLDLPSRRRCPDNKGHQTPLTICIAASLFVPSASLAQAHIVTVSDRRLSTERCPSLHHFSPLFQRVAATVGPLGLVRNRVRERRLTEFAAERADLARPVAERRAKAVGGNIHPLHATKHHQQRHSRCPAKT